MHMVQNPSSSQSSPYGSFAKPLKASEGFAKPPL